MRCGPFSTFSIWYIRWDARANRRYQIDTWDGIATNLQTGWWESHILRLATKSMHTICSLCTYGRQREREHVHFGSLSDHTTFCPFYCLVLPATLPLPLASLIPICLCLVLTGCLFALTYSGSLMRCGSRHSCDPRPPPHLLSSHTI